MPEYCQGLGGTADGEGGLQPQQGLSLLPSSTRVSDVSIDRCEPVMEHCTIAATRYALAQLSAIFFETSDRGGLREEAQRFAKCRGLMRGLVGQMKVKASYEVMVGLPCCRRFQERSFNLGFRNVCGQQWRNRAYDLVLNREYIVELSVVPF